MLQSIVGFTIPNSTCHLFYKKLVNQGKPEKPASIYFKSYKKPNQKLNKEKSKYFINGYHVEYEYNKKQKSLSENVFRTINRKN